MYKRPADKSHWIFTVGELLEILKNVPLETPVLIKDTHPEHEPKQYQQEAYIGIENVVQDNGMAKDMFDGVEYPFKYYRQATKDDKEVMEALLIR